MLRQVAIFFFLLSFVWQYAEGNKPVTDTGKLRRECSRSLEKKDFKTVKEKALRLRGLSRSVGNEEDYAYSGFFLGTSEVFAGDASKGVSYLREAYRLADSLRCDSLAGLALNGLGIYEANVNNNYYLAQRYFLKSLKYPGIEGSVYSNLAQIARLQRDTTGMEYARKCYAYGVNNKDSYYIYGGLTSRAEFHIFKSEYDSAMNLIEEARKLAKERKNTDTLRLDFLEAVILSHKNYTSESNRILLSLEDSIAQRAPIYLPELQFVVGKNYQKEGKYTESDRWFKKALESGSLHSSNDYVGMLNLELSDNSVSTGDYRGAVDYLRSAYDFSEKSARAELKRMESERELTFKLMEGERERELARAEARTTRIISIFLAILLVVAILGVILTVVSLHRRKKLYRHIVRQNVKMLEDADSYRNRIEELEDRMAKKGDLENSIKERRDSRSKDLFERLNRLMTEEEAFRDPRLTREDVIERLDTNATYLTQTIKENADMNYSQYINSFRISAAVKALSDMNKTDVPIKTVAEESGFNSITTFYKIFQQSVGLSPSAYRKSLKSL